jgi:hypothetical protein
VGESRVSIFKPLLRGGITTESRRCAVRACCVFSSCSRNWKPTSLLAGASTCNSPRPREARRRGCKCVAHSPYYPLLHTHLGLWKTGGSFPERYAYPELVCSGLQASLACAVAVRVSWCIFRRQRELAAAARKLHEPQCLPQKGLPYGDTHLYLNISTWFLWRFQILNCRNGTCAIETGKTRLAVEFFSDTLRIMACCYLFGRTC